MLLDKPFANSQVSTITEYFLFRSFNEWISELVWVSGSRATLHIHTVEPLILN